MEHFGAFVMVMNDKQEVLLGLRKNAYKSGYWGCPGGRCELMESLADCCRRELAEETGIRFPTLSYAGVVREFQHTYTFIHFAFLCTRWGGDIINAEPDKCTGWQWFPKNKLPTRTIPAHAQMISEFSGSPGSILIDLVP